MQNMLDSIYRYQLVSPSPISLQRIHLHSQSPHVPHSLLTYSASSRSCHPIVSTVPSTALDNIAQASWFFQLGLTHGTLPTLTHHATVLGVLLTIPSPQSKDNLPRYDPKICVHGTISKCGITCLLNACNTSTPNFLRSTSSILFVFSGL